MLKQILTLEGVEKLNKHQQSLLIGGTVDTEDDPNSGSGGWSSGGKYKKCKLCDVQSDCGEGTCASGIPYCPDGQKRCL